MSNNNLRYRPLTELEMESIERMFYGPFEKDWKVNGFVDNYEKTISMRLGIPIGVIRSYLEKVHELRLKLSIPHEVEELNDDFVMVTYNSRMNFEI